jgi:SOS-response transcriptional repressor LexA
MKEGADKPNTRERLKELAPGFGKRVRVAVDALGGVESAALVVPVGANQIRRIQNEETVPSFPAIAILAKKSGYRSEWLAFAEEPETSDAPADRPAPPPELQAVDFIWVPELDARAAAGQGLMNHEHPAIKAAYPIPRTMIASMGLDPMRLRILQARGTSMEPDIRDGDHMVIYTGEDELRDGGIYVFSIDADTMVKQVQLQPDGGLMLISKNPVFAPRPISAAGRQDLNFAGRLVMTLKRFV